VLVLGFIAGNFAVTTFAAETVKPYCTRTSTPVMAVNLGSNEDVSHGGTNLKSSRLTATLKWRSRGLLIPHIPPEQSMLSRLFRQRIAMKTMDWKSKTARMREAQRTGVYSNGDYTAFIMYIFQKEQKVL